MKLFISFLFSIIIFNSNLYASEHSRENFIKKSNENTKEITPKLSNEQLQELIKKLPNKDSLKKTYKETSSDFTEILKKIRPFIIPAIIIIWLITRSSDKPQDKPKKNTKTKRTRSRTQEFIKKHNEDHKNNKITETKNDKEYEDEWNYDQDELEQLRIKIEVQQVENLKVYDVEAIGMVGFTQDQVDQTKLENEEAKFTC